MEKEFESNEMLLKDIQLNFEISKKENLELKEALSKKKNEIDLVKKNLGFTEHQLNEYSTKLYASTLRDIEPEPTDSKFVYYQKKTATSKSVLANTSCQTINTANQCLETLDYSTKTPSSLNQFQAEKESTDAETKVTPNFEPVKIVIFFHNDIFTGFYNGSS